MYLYIHKGLAIVILVDDLITTQIKELTMIPKISATNDHQ